ncbi:tyrosine-type recombinase/integrase [Acidovorax sp. Q11]
MASIKKRGEYWRAQVRRKGYPAISRTFDTKLQAETWARATEGSMDQGVFRTLGDAEKMTLAEALERYWREVGSAKSYPKQEHQRIRHWQAQPLAQRYLSNLRGVDFAAYRDARRKLGRAENTVRLELQLVAHLFNVARKEWGMEGLLNPLNDIRKPSGSSERDRRLMAGEFEALAEELARCGNPWVLPAFELAIETTLRQGMLFKLERAWLDASGRFFRVPREHQGKGNKAVPAFVILSSRAAEIVVALPECGSGERAGKLLGCSQNAVSVAWKRALAAARRRYEDAERAAGRSPKAGHLQGLRWHDLRHEGASRLFERGLNPMEASAVTGHRSLSMLRRYVHLSPAQLLSKLG